MVNVDNRGTGGPRGSNNSLYFIVGALVIAVLIIGYFMYGGDGADTGTDVNVTTEDNAAPAGGATGGTTTGGATTGGTDTAAPAPAEPPAAAEPPPATPAPAEPAAPTPPPGGATGGTTPP